MDITVIYCLVGLGWFAASSVVKFFILLIWCVKYPKCLLGLYHIKFNQTKSCSFINNQLF